MMLMHKQLWYLWTPKQRNTKMCITFRFNTSKSFNINLIELFNSKWFNLKIAPKLIHNPLLSTYCAFYTSFIADMIDSDCSALMLLSKRHKTAYLIEGLIRVFIKSELSFNFSAKRSHWVYLAHNKIKTHFLTQSLSPITQSLQHIKVVDSANRQP